MLDRSHLNIIMPSWPLFSPADGHSYTLGDYERCMSQQPIKKRALPGYMRPDPEGTLYPPVVRYGWPIGHKRLMEIAQAQFPEGVVLARGPDLFGVDEEQELNAEDYRKLSPNTELTLFGPSLLLAIYDCFGIEDSELICISLLNSEMEDEDLGITIGTNYEGLVHPSQQDAIQAVFAPNVEPAWYLDSQHWHWRRSAKKRTSKRTAHAQSTVTTATQAIDA